MKRSAAEAKRLARALINEGHNVTPRKLERWSQQELGPAGPSDFSALVQHYAEVESLSKRGRDGDLVARRLAARGFACERLRGAILREFGIPTEPPSVIPPMPDLSTDRGDRSGVGHGTGLDHGRGDGCRELQAAVLNPSVRRGV